MALIIADRVKETTTTTGTGNFSLLGAMTGFRTFGSVCSVGDTVYYALQSVDGSGLVTAEWECGLGTYAGSNTLTRTTVTSSSNAGAAVSLSAGTKQVYLSVPAVQAAWPREKLAAARTYYVRTDGADTNTGLADTAGGAFLTIQKAVDAVSTIDATTYQVTVKIADGTYNESVVLRPCLGTLPLIIRGNLTTPGNVVVNGATCFLAAQPGVVVQILDLKLTASSLGLSATYAGKIEFGNLNFGACSNRHINAQYGGFINSLSSYTISGGSLAHITATTGGTVRVASVTVTLTGTPAFTSFIDFSSGAVGAVSSNTYSGAATGKRYNLTTNGVVDTAGATLPGDAAGTTATGGQYA